MDRGGSERGLAVYTRFLGDPSSETMVPESDKYFTPGDRWKPGSRSIIYSRPVETDDPSLNRQVSRYDMGSA